MKKFFKKINNKLKEDVEKVHTFGNKAREKIKNRINIIKNKIENKIKKSNNNNNNSDNSDNSDNSNNINNNNNNNFHEENNNNDLMDFFNDNRNNQENNVNKLQNNNKNNKIKEKIKLKNEDDIPQNYICPISYEIMIDPVITPYGISYDRESIEKWLINHDMDPIAHKKLNKNMLIPNYALKSLIEEYINANKIN
jgi:hypothetical protein